MGYLTSHRSQKVLVICAKAATALQLEQVLREREGIRAAVFHEGMSIIERDRAAAWFAEEDTGARGAAVLRDRLRRTQLPVRQQLVMFDLPFNPDLLEQRIGRLDRIGQRTISRSTFRTSGKNRAVGAGALVSRRARRLRTYLPDRSHRLRQRAR